MEILVTLKSLRLRRIATLMMLASAPVFYAPSAHADTPVNVLVSFNSVRFGLDDGGFNVSEAGRRMSQMYGYYMAGAPGQGHYKAIGNWGGGSCQGCGLDTGLGWDSTYTIGDSLKYPNGVGEFFNKYYGIPAEHFLPAHAGNYFFSEIPACDTTSISACNVGPMKKYNGTFKLYNVLPGQAIKLSAKFMDDDTLSSDDMICSISKQLTFSQSELETLNKNINMGGIDYPGSFTTDGNCYVNVTLKRVL
ncbi:hypothetical protein [Streptomyces wedmorensis]